MKKIVMLIALLAPVQLMWAQEALLWKVTGKDANKPSYLFASNIVCETNVKLSPIIESALAASKKVYFELPDAQPDSTYNRLTGLPAGDSLANYFSPQEYSILRTFVARRLRFDIEKLHNATPAFTFYALRNMITYCKDNTNYTDIIEGLAAQQGLPTGNLETPTDAVNAQLLVPASTYSRLIMDIVYETDRIKRQREEQMDLYRKQDITGMYNAHLQNKEAGGSEQAMLGNRNRRWIPVIKAAVTLEQSFFCVGALQLPGDEGLITLLRKEGFTVTAVR